MILVPPAPYSPWLRLAHRGVWDHASGPGTGTRRRLRDYCFLMQLSGESFVWYAGDGNTAAGSQPLRPGDVALIPPGHDYAWGVVPGSHIAVHFDLHAQPQVSADDMVEYQSEVIVPQHLRDVPRHHFVFSSAAGEAGRQVACRWVVRPASQARWRARFAPLISMWSRRDQHLPENRLLAAGILAEAFHAWLELAADAPQRTIDEPVARLIDEISAQPIYQVVDIPSLATRCRLGETAFRAAFARVAGVPPRAWLERRRMEYAAGLLRDTPLCIGDVAMTVGYGDAFHFSRVFHRVMGASPRAWRRLI